MKEANSSDVINLPWRLILYETLLVVMLNGFLVCFYHSYWYVVFNALVVVFYTFGYIPVFQLSYCYNVNFHAFILREGAAKMCHFSRRKKSPKVAWLNQKNFASVWVLVE